MAEQVRWTTIKVPKELRDQIKELADRFNTSEWRMVQWGISFIQEHLKNPRIKEDLPLLDKVTWYITKLVMTVGAFRENPTEEKLRQVRKVAQQVSERLGVDTRGLIRVCEDYLKNKDKREATDLKIEVTSETKIVVIDIIWKKLMDQENGLYSK